MCHHYGMCIFQFCWAIFSYTTFAFANSAKEKARSFVGFCLSTLGKSTHIRAIFDNTLQSKNGIKR